MKPQIWHIVVLIIVLIVVFGAAKLPDIAKSIGQSAKVFKKEMKELTEDVPPQDAEDEGEISEEK
ncbi:MAG: twin-arginine translocase TatA/TatE family subunit [Actinomycetaceae bacterium]|nr:twin-arginine translocase TatA/TatE family subunit [Actinomycetaceae bacterium]